MQGNSGKTCANASCGGIHLGDDGNLQKDPHLGDAGWKMEKDDENNGSK
jgi:hypothetical protein